jgi:hypothetical protein
MKPIAIWYHCLYVLGDPPKPIAAASWIVAEQMAQIAESGLLDAAAEMHVGINGSDDDESYPLATRIPSKAQVTYHGLQSRSENLSIVMLHEWAKTHPDWFVFYCHSKAATHQIGTPYFNSASAWRRGMMEDLVLNWRQCVLDLETHDIACSHWGWNLADGTQHIPMGNFLWATSNFIAQLPSMFLRDRIKQDGIAALSSRYEAEVFWGNGPRPNVKQYHPNGGNGIP